MCCSSASTKDVAPAVPVTLGADVPAVVAENAVVGSSSSRRFGVGVARPRPRACAASASLAARRAPAAPRVTNTRVTREDLDSVRVALEQELAMGRPRSDAEIVERVSSRKRQHHPLVTAIVLSKLREQNAAFFASYDAKRRRRDLSTSTPSTASTSPGNGDDAATALPLRAGTSSSPSEEEEEGTDAGCQNNNSNLESSSSDEDAVVPFFFA